MDDHGWKAMMSLTIIAEAVSILLHFGKTRCSQTPLKQRIDELNLIITCLKRRYKLLTSKHFFKVSKVLYFDIFPNLGKTILQTKFVSLERSGLVFDEILCMIKHAVFSYG